MEVAKQGLLIVLSGPSGIGKGTVLNGVLNCRSDIKISTSVTTRKPRAGEKDGVDYFFTSKEKFLEMVENSEFLEYTNYCGNFYGTLKKNLFNMVGCGNDVILEIEVDGGNQIKEKFPDSVSIFIVPPSVDTLRQRLMDRGLDEKDVINDRLHRAKQEIGSAFLYDYIVVNDSLESCVKDVCKIIDAEHMRAKRLYDGIKEGLENGKSFVD